MISEVHFQTVLDIWNERQEQSACTITGNCMSPMIREGDTLVIRHGSRDIRMGDVVVFGAPGKFRVHRVVGIERRDGVELFLLKADRKSRLHRPVSRGEILGKVIEVRGAEGRFRLDSVFWRTVNYILSIRSYVNARKRSADSVLWKGLNAVSVLRSRVLPRGYGIGHLLWKQICWVHRICFDKRAYGLKRGTVE